MKRLNAHERERQRSMLEKHYGLYLDDEQFQALMDRNPDVQQYLRRNGTDTPAREWLIDCIVKEAGLKRWPLNSDDFAYTLDFSQNMLAYATRMGYTFDVLVT